jgi:hypothetical protein
MKTLPACPPTAPQLDDELFVPDELVGRLYRAGDGPVVELLAGMSSDSRANLAMFCYRKAHLRRMGLEIAATCEWSSLLEVWGPALAHAISAQAHGRAAAEANAAARRPQITLARCAEPLKAGVE